MPLIKVCVVHKNSGERTIYSIKYIRKEERYKMNNISDPLNKVEK